MPHIKDIREDIFIETIRNQGFSKQEGLQLTNEGMQNKVSIAST